MINQESLSKFESISLEEMGKVKLMNRVDSKYVTYIGKIHELLQLAIPYYKVQEINGELNMPYYTCYYDTPEQDMFYQHQRGKKTRQKIRCRKYEGSDTPPFLEIKSKNNKGRTKKKRVEMLDGMQLTDYNEFLETHTPYPPAGLIPKLENHFYRITLVNHEMTERITIDTGLEFHNFETDVRLSLPEIGIIEWKRDGRAEHSHLKEILRNLRIFEGGFSKYAIGMAFTNPELKQNRLKKRLRNINKIISKEKNQ